MYSELVFNGYLWNNGTVTVKQRISE